jgi:hypothetical protein
MILPEQLTVPLQTASVVTVLGTLVGYLPPVAALIGIIVGLIAIYESQTFRHWKYNRDQRVYSKKLAKIRAREKKVLAVLQATETARAGRVEARELIADARSEAAALIVHAAAVAASPVAPQ